MRAAALGLLLLAGCASGGAEPAMTPSTTTSSAPATTTTLSEAAQLRARLQAPPSECSKAKAARDRAFLFSSSQAVKDAADVEVFRACR